MGYFMMCFLLNSLLCCLLFLVSDFQSHEGDIQAVEPYS